MAVRPHESGRVRRACDQTVLDPPTLPGYRPAPGSSREALGARVGDRILDVGCGPGFASVQVAAEVGPTLALSSGCTELRAHASRPPDAVAPDSATADSTLPAPLGCRSTIGAWTAPSAFRSWVGPPLSLSPKCKSGCSSAPVDGPWSGTWIGPPCPGIPAESGPDAADAAGLGPPSHPPALPRLLTAALRQAGFTDVQATGYAFTTTTLYPEMDCGFALGAVQQMLVVFRISIKPRSPLGGRAASPGYKCPPLCRAPGLLHGTLNRLTRSLSGPRHHLSPPSHLERTHVESL